MLRHKNLRDNKLTTTWQDSLSR